MARRKKDKLVTVRKTTTAMRSWPGPLVFSLLVAAAGIYTLFELATLARLADTVPAPAIEPTVLGLPWPWFAGVAALVILPIVQVFWRSRMSRYRVCADRLIESHGLLGRQTTEMATSDIREVLVRRTFGQRLLGLGDVVALGDGGPSVQFRNVSGPRKMAALIEDVRAGKLPGESSREPAKAAEIDVVSDAKAASGERAAPERRSPAEVSGTAAEARGRPEKKPAARPKKAEKKEEASDGDARDELWRLLEEQAAEQEK